MNSTVSTTVSISLAETMRILWITSSCGYDPGFDVGKVSGSMRETNKYAFPHPIYKIKATHKVDSIDTIVTSDSVVHFLTLVLNRRISFH